MSDQIFDFEKSEMEAALMGMIKDARKSFNQFMVNADFSEFDDLEFRPGEIKKTLSTLNGQPEEEIKLYLKNKGPIEDITTNHDQQIVHETSLYAVYKGEKINDILKAAQIEVRPNNNPEKPVIKLNPVETNASSS